MSDEPHFPAAFINAIREEGTHKEACDWLQQTWNELMLAQAEIKRLSALPAVQPDAHLVTGPKCECGMTGPCMLTECKAPILRSQKGQQP